MRRLGWRSQRSYEQGRTGLDKHEWWMPVLAEAIGMPVITLYNWVWRGFVKARQEESGRWIVWADKAEVARLKRHHRRPRGDDARRRWVEELPPLDSETTAKDV